MDERRRRFEAQVLPHLDAANNLARWLSRNDTAADDIVQEAMLRAYRAFDSIRGEDARPWLLAIVRNCHHTLFKRSRLRPTVPLPEEGGEQIATSDPDPERAAIGADQARKLDKAIRELPEEFREALILREMEEMSYREIAEATDVPIGTVMSRLARARGMLREKWLKGVGDGMQ
jgi:RNA polymerase sigma factor (sigma-70 family)